jgi:hypothetical protein
MAIILLVVMYAVLQFIFFFVGGFVGGIWTILSKSMKGLAIKGVITACVMFGGPFVTTLLLYPPIFEFLFHRNFWALLSTPVI